ncbi:MAG TPA: dicarboxylate/amino acid:cation symporter [Geomonas sp.]|nr:dicarboxylate/amino acid:cation symporter [Geomonas sp.]
MRWRELYKSLYLQVLCGIAIGILLGIFDPDLGAMMKPLGDGFIKLIKMIIAPVIFCTVVSGITGMDDMKKVGRVGGKALLYFEVLSTLALLIGLVIVTVVRPGAGFNADVSKLDTSALTTFAAGAKTLHTADFLMNIIPYSVVDAFAKGDILQVLFFSLLFGFALAAFGEKGKPVAALIDQVSHVMFGIVGIIMRAAPLGAFGAMAFTISKFGIGSLARLGLLMGSFYATCLIYIFGVLGIICKLLGFNIFQFICYIKEELLIVLGTSSSESVLPRMMSKMEKLGCTKSVVGLVIPTGYSFNLDGTSIYLTMAAIFVAQATNTILTPRQTLTILAILILTSKGAAAVTGGGFITLAATFAAVPTIPLAGLALILGIDRFMSEARALTNLIGNGVATVVISRWEKELDVSRLQQTLHNKGD